MIGKTISHYKILEKLGEGGMGVVYKAEDMKLDRFVALKFLPSHLIDDEKALKRLLKEAKAASKINHPNVCTIYAIEDYEDTHFIVMEFVDGQTLKAEIKKEKPSIDEAVEYSIQICKALKAAHDKGIIHRDIKSENIMINNENMIKVMDFGLAKLKDEAGLTKTKTAGTIAYMSPEQIQGFEIDTRTDIWSFGVVMYEMLTGRFPFKGEYESAMMYSIVNVEPEPMKDIPEELERTIFKALTKSSDNRYQSAEDVLKDLNKAKKEIELKISKDETKEEKSIVVLPFVNMSPDPEQEYFSDGLTEEIITDLSHIHELRVISRTSAMMLKGTKKDMRTISRELNVQYVLEGSVRKAGNNLRITAQLIDAINDKHLWAEKYSGTLDDVFDIQEKVSRSIVDALKVKLSTMEKQKIAERPIQNVYAYECYLKARQEIWGWTEESLDRALQYLENGLEIEGENAILYAGMGYVYWQYVNTGTKSDEAYLNKAREYAEKALELEPNLSYGHIVLGLLKLWNNPKQGIMHLKKALDIDPNNWDALIWIGAFHGYIGKYEASLIFFERGEKIDPLNPMNQICIGMAQMYEGKFDLALEFYHKSLQSNPKDIVGRYLLALTLAYTNHPDEAYSLFDEITKEEPDQHYTRLGQMIKYSLQGNKNEIMQYLTEEAKTWLGKDFVYAKTVAESYALIGDKKQALDWLEHAVSIGFINYPFLNEYDPFLKNIRGEERFKKLMERVKYEWENFEV